MIYLPSDMKELRQRIYERVSKEPAQKKQYSFLRQLLFSILAAGRKAVRKDIKDLKRVLLIRYDGIGDLILTQPFIASMKRLRPDVLIDVVCSERNEQLLKHNPMINRYYVLDSGNIRSSFRKQKPAIRKNGYDMIFGLVYTKMSDMARMAASISRTAEIISFSHGARDHIYGKVFSRLVPQSAYRLQYADQMQHLFNSVFKTDYDEKPGIFVSDEAKEFVKLHNTEAELFNGETGGKYILINVSAHEKERELSDAAVKMIAAMILEKFSGYDLVISGAPSDSMRVKAVIGELADPRVRQVEMSLERFMAFTALASMVITPSTATTHAAAAAGVPEIAFYNTEYQVLDWYPYGVEFAALASGNPSDASVIDREDLEAAVRYMQGIVR